MRRRIDLTGGRFIIFDYNSPMWRIAYYRKRMKGEVGNEPGPHMWKALATAGLIPLVERTKYCRFATKHVKLDSGIAAAMRLAEDYKLIPEVIEYLDCTEWGKAALAL